MSPRLTLMLLCVGCGSSEVPYDAAVADTPAPDTRASSDAGEADATTPDASSPPLGFVDVTDEAGLGELVQWDETFPVPCTITQSRDCAALASTGGVAIRDVDGDGLDDLLLTEMEGQDHLLLNRGGYFEEVSNLMGLPADYGFTNGAAFGDIDNDGDADLYVGGVGEWSARLFIFEDGAYVESSNDWNVSLRDDGQHTQMSACFGDMDLDGLLDLHTTEWRTDDPGRRTTHGVLLRNTGDAFVDETSLRGVSMLDVGTDGIWSYTSNFLDLDGDRFPELIVASDFDSSRLFWNERGAVFTDGTESGGLGTDENGMGSTLGDIDGDGDLDWFISAIHDPTEETRLCDTCPWGTSGNRLFRYEGAREFTDITDQAGVRDASWAWGTRFFDYDLDGDLDLIVTNGVRWPPEHAGFLDDPIRLWENDGTGRFHDVAELHGIDGRGFGRGLVTFDYDGDGDEDVLVVNNLDGPRLWRNDISNGRAWLAVKPIGETTNRDGFGVIVRVWPTEDSNPIIRHSGNGCHFLAHTMGTPRFGLLDLESVHHVELFWPASKTTQHFYDVPTRQTLIVHESDPSD